MPLNQRTIEDNVRIAIMAASGYGDQFVIHRNENDNAPDADYIAFSLGVLIPIGQDALTTSVNLARPAGQEVEIKLRGDREFSVLIEAFTEKTNAETSARSILGRLQTRLQLPSIRRPLYDIAGVSIFDFGEVDYLPQIGSTVFYGRGQLTIRCYAKDDDADLTGYIATVELVDTGTGAVVDIPVG